MSPFFVIYFFDVFLCACAHSTTHNVKFLEQNSLGKVCFSFQSFFNPDILCDMYNTIIALISGIKLNEIQTVNCVLNPRSVNESCFNYSSFGASFGSSNERVGSSSGKERHSVPYKVHTHSVVPRGSKFFSQPLLGAHSTTN